MHPQSLEHRVEKFEAGVTRLEELREDLNHRMIETKEDFNRRITDGADSGGSPRPAQATMTRLSTAAEIYSTGAIHSPRDPDRAADRAGGHHRTTRRSHS